MRAEFQKDNRARVERADGYQQLKAKLHSNRIFDGHT
ncbi:23S rRNA (adenine(2030)-N(6))-methyltransferase RlmJ [Salmonella enterica subsp. enterica serovar Montevideo]|nr:23S rRNA (adenine(2030)-N(6))-methyltransferase RlmJ [Salmonella enterica subsp. enterica serovar Montevideo]